MLAPIISVCIITLGRPTLYRALHSLFAQHIEVGFEVVIINQGDLIESQIALSNIKNIDIIIKKCPNNLGFGYYRNVAINIAKGDVIVFMDDDVWTNNKYWLYNLTRYVLIGRYKAVTSGLNIQLGKGYWTDSISVLGYPGGGAIGFECVWPVKNNSVLHICGANFCISRNLLREIKNFNINLRASCDDNFLADKIIDSGNFIFYEKEATLSHIHRDFFSFFQWQLRRFVGAKEYYSIQKNKKHFFQKLQNKIYHLRSLSKYLIKKPKYIPGILLLLLFMFFIFISSLFRRE